MDIMDLYGVHCGGVLSGIQRTSMADIHEPRVAHMGIFTADEDHSSDKLSSSYALREWSFTVHN
jgi:hypothetical protein